MARGDDESTPSAGAEAEGRSVGTRGWFIISECHWLTIIGELRSLWFIIINRFRNPNYENVQIRLFPIFNFSANCNTLIINWQAKRRRENYRGFFLEYSIHSESHFQRRMVTNRSGDTSDKIGRFFGFVDWLKPGKQKRLGRSTTERLIDHNFGEGQWICQW